MLISFLLQLLFATLLSGCTAAITAEKLTSVRVQVMWVPNAQFAGYYVAMDKGFYRQEGLDVIINDYDPNVSVRDVIVSGQVEFGIDGAIEVLSGRGEGQEIKAVFVDYRISPTGFASLSSSNINHPQDWVGKRIGFLPDSTGTIFKTILSRYDIQEEQMTFADYSYDFGMLTDGIVDVIPVYIFDEPYALEQKGYEINTLLACDYGVNFYGDTLFTSTALIEENPELVQRFVNATLKGWQYALQNQNEAIEIILKYDDEGYHDREYEQYILSRESPLVHTGEDSIGWMKAEIWQEMYTIMNDSDLIQQPFDVSDSYTMQFLQNINQ